MKRNLLSFFIKYKLLIIAIFLLFFSVVVIQVNYNKNAMDNSTVDEYYTIATIHPKLTPDKTIHRALSGPRMFTYLFYPGALVGMIGHMGGNVYEDSWKYPGHNYFLKNYKTASTALSLNMKDPNLRYLHYYLKLQAIFLMFLTLIPILHLLWKRNYFIAMFMLAVTLGVNFLLLEERSLFYIEPLLVSMMNLLIWLYFFIAEKKQLTWFWVVFSSFLFALTISLKFSSVFLIFLVAVLICSKFKSLEKRIMVLALLILCSSLFFSIINWDIFYSKEVFNSVVHDYFSNFWQYATGKNGKVVESYKLYNFKNIIREIFPSLGGLVFLTPLLLFFGLRWTSKKSLLMWSAFIFVIFLSITLIIKQRLYVDRNILPFLPALIIITGVMLDNIVNKIRSEEYFKKKTKPIYLYIIIVLLVFLPIWGHSKNYFETVFPSAKKNVSRVLKKLENTENRRLIKIDYPIKLDGQKFRVVKKLPSANGTNGSNIKSFIKKSIADFEPEDIVVVSEIKNNKQLTNYVLPAIFNTNKQFSNYFVFYNTEDKNQRISGLIETFNNERTQLILDYPVNIREDLVLEQIKLAKMKKGFRIYFKFEFLSMDTQDWDGCRFFFHGNSYEKDIQRLPSARVEFGYENWDFSISKKNTVWYGNSMYVFHDFNPSLKEYRQFNFGIFSGCSKSKKFGVDKVDLSW